MWVSSTINNNNYRGDGNGKTLISNWGYNSIDVALWSKNARDLQVCNVRVGFNSANFNFLPVDIHLVLVMVVQHDFFSVLSCTDAICRLWTTPIAKWVIGASGQRAQNALEFEPVRESTNIKATPSRAQRSTKTKIPWWRQPTATERVQDQTAATCLIQR